MNTFSDGGKINHEFMDVHHLPLLPPLSVERLPPLAVERWLVVESDLAETVEALAMIALMKMPTLKRKFEKEFLDSNGKIFQHTSAKESSSRSF